MKEKIGLLYRISSQIQETDGGSLDTQREMGRRISKKLGFKVFELENGKRHKLSRKTYLTIYPADDCDPELCFKFNGCAQLNTDAKGSQQIDSLSVIDNGKFSILNVNDCPYDLSNHIIKTKVLKDFKKINLLLTGYGGAGAYPQCFENLSTIQKNYESKKKQENFLTQSINYITLTKPEHYIPFAGTYVLSGKLNLLQNLMQQHSFRQHDQIHPLVLLYLF